MPNRQDKCVREGKVFAILGYLSILCIIPLIFKKDNSFVLLHSKQGLVLFLGEVAVFILNIILPIWIIKTSVFILFVISFFGILAVLDGQKFKIPVVSKLAEKIVL